MQDSHEAPSILFEIAHKDADSAVVAKKARHLKNIEVAVLKEAWLDRRILYQ